MKKNSFFDDVNVTVNPNMKVHPNPCPEKMARAIKFIEENGLPDNVERTKKWKKQHKKDKKSKKASRSTLQNELLTVYNFEPTEEQMQQLKDFLAQFF